MRGASVAKAANL